VPTYLHALAERVKLASGGDDRILAVVPMSDPEALAWEETKLGVYELWFTKLADATKYRPGQENLLKELEGSASTRF
jgi:hypothetical protein